MSGALLDLRHRAALVALGFLAFGGYVKGLPGVSTLAGVDTSLLAAVVVLVAVVLVLSGPSRPPASLLLISALAGAMAVPGAIAELDATTMQRLTSGLVLMVLCLLGGALLLRSGPARRYWLVLVVVVGCLVAALVRLFPEENTGGSGAIGLAGSNAISVGRAVGAAVVVLGVWCVVGRRHRWAAGGLLSLLTIAMLQSGARGPTLAGGVAVLVVAAVVARRGRSARLAVAGAGLGLVAYVTTTAGAFVSARLAARFTDFDDTSSQARVELWERTTWVLASNPAGVGWGRLAEHLPAAGYEGLLIPGIYPHNVFLEVGVEGGWLALLVLAVTLACAGRHQLVGAQTSSSEAAFLGLLVFFLMNAMVSGELGDNRGLWVAVGAALAAWRSCADDPSAGRSSVPAGQRVR